MISKKETGRERTIGLSFSVLFIFLFLFSSVSAVPPFQVGISTNALDVAGVDFTSIQLNTARTAVAFLFNQSTGLPVNSGANCTFQVFRVAQAGALVFTNNTPSIVGNRFSFGIPNTVYTLQGEYTRIIQCNTSTQGGFYKSTLYAATNGLTGTLGFYFIFIILIIGLFILGYSTENNQLMMLASLLVLFLGFFVIINGIDVVKDTTTTWAIGLILWAVGIICIYISLQGQLKDGYGG